MWLLQVGQAVPTTAWDLVVSSSRETKIVLTVLGCFSLASWFLIVLKWWEFVKVRREAAKFFEALEHTSRLDDGYRAIMKLPSSPYGRIFREGIRFFSELKPGAVQSEAESTDTLTETQLEALQLVLAKEIAVERDSMARFLPWLATFGSVSPLLGLLGTVLGVMNAFIGIALSGSGNIQAVAPGVAEALVTTVMGLAVAIPAVIAYNIFVSRLGLFAGELEGFSRELIATMAREGRL